MDISAVLTLQEEQHTILQLGRDDRVVQKCLQWLEGELRKGRHPSDARNLRAAVLQCVERNDLKVKRWALNVLAELGALGQIEVLDSVFPHVADDPDLLASAVRLLFREARQGPALTLLQKNEVGLSALALIAGSEYSGELRKRLVAERIPLNHATPEELRAAIVLAGRGKAPEFLFERSHENCAAIPNLNLHDEPSVIKYSLWYMAETNIEFSHLKIKLEDFDACDPQVRKWILRLLFSNESVLSQNIDLISHASKDDEVDVREEAAIGLRNSYADSAAKEVIRWFTNERVDSVRHAIIDHFAKFSHRNERYEALIREIYRAETFRSPLRGRIEAAVAGTDLFRQLRVHEIKEESFDLFSNDNDIEGFFMPKVVQNFPNAQIGAVTGKGPINIDNQTVQGGMSPDMVAALIKQFVAVTELVRDVESRKEGERLLDELKAQPKEGFFKRAIGWTQTITSGANAGSELVKAGTELMTTLEGIGGIV